MQKFGGRVFGVWAACGLMPLVVSAQGQGGEHGPPRAIPVDEALLTRIEWKSVAEIIDNERSNTLHALSLGYAKDRGEEPRPFRRLTSLSEPRKIDVSGVDACLAITGEKTLTFADVMQRSLRKAMDSRVIKTNSVIDAPGNYNLLQNRTPVGWLSHSFCTFDPKNILGELEHSLDEKVVPDVALARDLNRYLLHSNHLRDRVLASDSALALNVSMSEYTAYQGILMGCLAYTESLGGTESEEGDEIFANLNRRAYVAKSTRPEGVAIGVDRPADFYVGNRSRREQIELGLRESLTTYKDQMGRERTRYLNLDNETKDLVSKAPTEAQKKQIKKQFVISTQQKILQDQSLGLTPDEIHKKYFAEVSNTKWISAGVYQFKFGDLDTPNGDVMSSNIGPCVDQWNEIYKNRCPIEHKLDSYAKALTSPGQGFNIFCGTQKVLQSFNVQVHTQNPAMTAKQNLKPDGTLKDPKDRCVHPFWKGGRAYNHFGPLANSAPKGSILSLPSFPGNLKILTDCIHNNGAKVFGPRR